MINLKTEYKDFLALLAILSLSLAGFIFFGYDRFAQSVIIVLTGVLYVLWGAGHHLLRGDFHLKVLVEYLTVATLAVILVLTLLQRV